VDPQLRHVYCVPYDPYRIQLIVKDFSDPSKDDNKSDILLEMREYFKLLSKVVLFFIKSEKQLAILHDIIRLTFTSKTKALITTVLIR